LAWGVLRDYAFSRSRAQHIVPNPATTNIMLIDKGEGWGMSVITEALDLVKTAEHPKLIIIGIVVIVCLAELLVGAGTSSKDIKFWGMEIKVPESDAIKACRAIQAAFHEKALGLESERQATYRRIESDEASLDGFTKLQLEAIARDADPNNHTSGNERTVVWRINSLIEDENSREKHLTWLNHTAEYDTERVNQECSSLLTARSG
jgi:hypothetical protein